MSRQIRSQKYVQCDKTKYSVMSVHIKKSGLSLTDILNLFHQTSIISNMQDIHGIGYAFMIKSRYRTHEMEAPRSRLF